MSDGQQQTYVIAEMAWSHDGSADLADKIVRDAAAAGADAISIHITHLPDYMVPHYGAGPGRVSAGKDTKPVYEYLGEINLGFEDWTRIAATAKAVDLDILIMPNDRASLAFARKLQPTAYVISAACFEELEFVAEVAREKRPIYLRVGGATLGEIENVLGAIRQEGNEKIILLYGHQNYPTAVGDNHLAYLTTLRDTFGLPVGVADHMDADDAFALILPLLAIPLGASCVEKHITHDRGKRGEDFESALNGDEFAVMVKRIRDTEAALGRRQGVGIDDPSARAYRQVSRKRLVAARDLKKGEKLTADMMIAKRADEGVTPALKGLFVGRAVRRDVARDQGIDVTILED